MGQASRPSVSTPIDSPETRERLQKAFDGQMRIAGGEDFPAQEAIQANLDSGLLPEVIFGRNEGAAIHFLEGLDELLRTETEA